MFLRILTAVEVPAVWITFGFIIGLIVIPLLGQKLREGTNQQTHAFGEEYYARRWVQRFEHHVRDSNWFVNGAPTKPLQEIKEEALLRVWRDIQTAAWQQTEVPQAVEGVPETWEEWPKYYPDEPLDIAPDIQYSEGVDGHGHDETLLHTNRDTAKPDVAGIQAEVGCVCSTGDAAAIARRGVAPIAQYPRR